MLSPMKWRRLFCAVRGMPGNAPKHTECARLASDPVLVCSRLQSGELEAVVNRFGATLVWLDDDQSIQGSYWGDREAGLVGDRLYVRGDTPVHSALHELCHYVCMPTEVRASLDTNAGGDYDEENGVCFLQILLADQLPACGRSRMLSDMDEWGYTFRLGSAKAWFEGDAADAREWLEGHGLIDASLNPTWALRDSR